MGASIRSSGALILVEMCHSIGNGFHEWKIVHTTPYPGMKITISQQPELCQTTM